MLITLTVAAIMKTTIRLAIVLKVVVVLATTVIKILWMKMTTKVMAMVIKNEIDTR